MKKLLFFIAALGVIFTACNKNEVDVMHIEETTTKMSFKHNIENVESGSFNARHAVSVRSGSTFYKRGNAPVYIKGVKIDVEHEFLTGKLVSREFMFVDFDSKPGYGEDISIDGITIGKNKVRMTGIPANPAVNFGNYTNNLPDKSASLKDRSIHYWKDIVKKAPIYAEYYGESDVDVKLNGDNNCNVDLKPQTGRINIIVEACEGYKCELTGFGNYNNKNDYDIKMESNSKEAWFVYLNSENVREGYVAKEMFLTVRKEKNDEVIDIFPIKDVKAINGKNIIHLIRYNGKLEESSNFDLDFEPIEDKFTGEDFE